MEEFPKGSYEGQRGDGYFINDLLKYNIDTLCRNITKDQQFVGLITGDGTVRNGKSTIAQQIGHYYSSQVNVPFSLNNIVFRAEDLIERGFKLPQYSCLILDEGDDLTLHHFSKLSIKLKKFFRKCGQLNLFIILILPNFFELPKGYATTRSNFLINVKFLGEFQRGYFDFFGPKNKKYLYFKGRKYEDYQANIHDFHGRFPPLYTVDEKLYRDMKREDAEGDGLEEKKVDRRSILKEIYCQVRQQIPFKTQEELAEAFGFTSATGRLYFQEYLREKQNLQSTKTENEN